jgi:hypothetical protein
MNNKKCKSQAMAKCMQVDEERRLCCGSLENGGEQRMKANIMANRSADDRFVSTLKQDREPKPSSYPLC